MRKTKPKKSILEGDISIGGVSLVQKALFAKHLSVMLKSGLSLNESLSITEDSARGKFKNVIGDVLRSVESGRPLSSALATHPGVFSNLFVNATQAGEKSGTLVESFENIAEELGKENELISKIRGAMLYPSVVLVAAFGLGIVLSFIVLPKITPLFEGLKIDLPFTTRAVIWLSKLIQEHGIVLFIGIVAFIAIVFWVIRQKFSKPYTHWLLLNVPIIKNVIKNANLARFSRTLGMLLKSGVNIDEALEITKNAMGNYHYEHALAQVSKNVSMGSKLAENLSIHEKLFPILATRMIKVGEESGKFEETLFYLSDFYEAEVENSTKSLSTAVEPILLIIIGLVVGFLALSIITPIYEVTGNIRR